MDFLVHHLKNFIAFKSESFRSNAPLARHVGRVLKKSGFEVSYQKIRHQGALFVNVIGVKGRGKNPLVLCSHLDTVPPGDFKKWTATGGDPWKARLVRGKMHGLGSADDKGPMVSMIEAGKRFSAGELKRPLVVAGTFGEESTMRGARLLLESFKKSKPSLVIAGEPTDLEIVYRHKGIGVAQIELVSSNKQKRAGKSRHFYGTGGHSSRPWLGDNALDKAVVFLKKMADQNPESSVGGLWGGHAVNLIPDKAEVISGSTFPAGAIVDCWECVRSLVGKMSAQRDRTFRPDTLTSNFGVAAFKKNTLRLLFDFRVLPGQSMEKIFRQLEISLAKKMARYPEIHFKMEIERDHPPLEGHSKDRLPRRALGWLKEAGLGIRLGVKSGCTEAGLYAKKGVPALVFGPGESFKNIHAPNECVPMAQLRQAADFYAHVIQKICVEGETCF